MLRKTDEVSYKIFRRKEKVRFTEFKDNSK